MVEKKLHLSTDDEEDINVVYSMIFIPTRWELQTRGKMGKKKVCGAHATSLRRAKKHAHTHGVTHKQTQGNRLIQIHNIEITITKERKRERERERKRERERERERERIHFN